MGNSTRRSGSVGARFFWQNPTFVGVAVSSAVVHYCQFAFSKRFHTHHIASDQGDAQSCLYQELSYTMGIF